MGIALATSSPRLSLLGLSLASSPGVVINTGPRFWVSSGRNLPVAMMATPVMIGANPGNISMAEVVDQSKPSASPY